jgi:hypothetical protein
MESLRERYPQIVDEVQSGQAQDGPPLLGNVMARPTSSPPCPISTTFQTSNAEDAPGLWLPTRLPAFEHGPQADLQAQQPTDLGILTHYTGPQNIPRGNIPTLPTHSRLGSRSDSYPYPSQLSTSANYQSSSFTNPTEDIDLRSNSLSISTHDTGQPTLDNQQEAYNAANTSYHDPINFQVQANEPAQSRDNSPRYGHPVVSAPTESHPFGSPPVIPYGVNSSSYDLNESIWPLNAIPTWS